MVANAKAEARRTMEALRPHLEAGTPIVGIEPSCVFTFRDECRALFPGEKLPEVRMLDEYLAPEVRAGRLNLVPRAFDPAGASQPRHVVPRRIRVHGHCHQKAFATFDDTIALLQAIPGADVAPIESSCCGMAGSFGHEKGHYDVSLRMAEAALAPAIRADGDATIAASGASCRQQIADTTGRVARHPVTLLAEAL
jgi:Fe-S oxidoreductase